MKGEGFCAAALRSRSKPFPKPPPLRSGDSCVRGLEGRFPRSAPPSVAFAPGPLPRSRSFPAPSRRPSRRSLLAALSLVAFFGVALLGVRGVAWRGKAKIPLPTPGGCAPTPIRPPMGGSLGVQYFRENYVFRNMEYIFYIILVIIGFILNDITRRNGRP